MSLYIKYEHQHYENGLYKLLFESDWSTLYVWYDADLLVHKVQFEHRGKWVIEIGESLKTISRINQEGTFNQEFLRPISMDSEMEAIVDDIEIPGWRKLSRVKTWLKSLEWGSSFYLN